MAEPTIRLQAESPTRKRRIERRVWVRTSSDRDVSCQKMPGLAMEKSDTGWPGKVRDVSTGGIALVLPRRFEMGTILILESETSPAELRRVIEVVHVAAETDDRWIIGCVFASPLGEDELQIFASQKQPSEQSAIP